MRGDDAHHPRKERGAEARDGENGAGFACGGVIADEQSEGGGEKRREAETKQDADDGDARGVSCDGESDDERGGGGEADALQGGFTEPA